jgi:hypothetical protein
MHPIFAEGGLSMNSVIITDYGVMLGKTGERLVVRGPRLELIAGGASALALRLERRFTWKHAV